METIKIVSSQDENCNINKDALENKAKFEQKKKMALIANK